MELPSSGTERSTFPSRNFMPYKDPEKRRECARKWASSERGKETAQMWRSNNLEKVKACQKRNRREAREKDIEGVRKYFSEYARKWRLHNKEKYLKYNREWQRSRRVNNPEKVRAGNRAYAVRRYQTDSNYRLIVNTRTRLTLALRGRIKSGRTFELLGCTLSELRAHLEKQFRPGMTWENYGPVWHADHIRPCASFDLADPEQQKICFHFSNLQPLFKEENLKKGAKYSAHL